MIRRLSYIWLVGTRSRGPLLPLAASLFMLIGIFADPRQRVGETFGLCAVVCCALTGLLVGSVLAGEPAAQADIATVALGGRARRMRLELALVALVGLGLTVAYVVYPVVMVHFRPRLFLRAIRPGDVAAAALAIACCTVLGGSLGLLFSPPRVTRRSTAVAAMLFAIVALVALSKPLGSLSGPVGAGHALTNAPPGVIAAGEVTSCVACVILAAACVLAAALWTRRTA